MATYTVRLKDALAFTGGTVEIDPVTGISKITGGNIGLNYYPEWKADYRARLNGIIYDHYQNQEIGQETIEMFQLAVRRRMNEVMPYFNQLYKSTEIEFDPLSTIDLDTLSTGTTAQNATQHATNNTANNSTNASRSVASDTPQTMLSDDADYASSAADVNGAANSVTDATEDTSSDATATANNDSKTKGYTGPAAALLMQYRQSIINIDLEVIRALTDCFMLVWDNGDTYSDHNSYIY